MFADYIDITIAEAEVARAATPWDLRPVEERVAELEARADEIGRMLAASRKHPHSE